jgi:hypothetical protein
MCRLEHPAKESGFAVATWANEPERMPAFGECEQVVSFQVTVDHVFWGKRSREAERVQIAARHKVSIASADSM